MRKGLVAARATAAVPVASAIRATPVRRRWALGACLLAVLVLAAACAPVAPPVPRVPPPVPDPHMIPPEIPPFTGASVEPVRILLVGDSTMGGMKRMLEVELQRAGYPAIVEEEAYGATGIGGKNPVPPRTDFDWLVKLNTLLNADLTAGTVPDVVVAQFIGSFGTPASTTSRGVRFTEIAHAFGVKVVWTRTPAIRSPQHQRYYDNIIHALDAIPADARSDWRSLITPGDRWWEFGITDRAREHIRYDNLHFTTGGQRLLAKATLDTLLTLGLWPVTTSTDAPTVPAPPTTQPAPVLPEIPPDAVPESSLPDEVLAPGPTP